MKKQTISIEEAKAVIAAEKAAKETAKTNRFILRHFGFSKPAPEEVKPAKAAKTTEKYTRADAFAQAVKEGAGKKEEIIKLSAKIYAEKTGNDVNEKEAAWYANTVIPGLIALGLADMKDGVLAVFFPVAKAA